MERKAERAFRSFAETVVKERILSDKGKKNLYFFEKNIKRDAKQLDGTIFLAYNEIVNCCKNIRAQFESNESRMSGKDSRSAYNIMKTYMANAQTVERKWYVVDAAGLPLGRVASKVASILRGKNKPTFTPNVDTGDFVIIINSDKVVLTGKKLEDKFYRYHTGYIGGLKEIAYGKMMAERSDLAVYEAVRGMLPKNSLGRQMIKKLRVYKGAEHNHAAQKPETLKLF